jgi:ferric-dicitrate binding protein FerR (iron transport regulator)
MLKIAALWILLFSTGCLCTWFITRKSTVEANNHITEIAAPLGAKSNITLPDGTKVWLNAGSKIVYNTSFDQKDRVVSLTGEAYFHLKTNPNKPFIVKTSDMMVRALGTRFNVKAYPDEKTITATLEEGKIDVQMNNSTEDQPKIILKPNENIVFIKGPIHKPAPDRTIEKPKADKAMVAEDKVELQQNVKTVLFTSWKEERWIIEGEPLSSLVPKLERRFNLKIIFASNDLKKYKFTGTIQNETVEQIMKALCFTAPLEFTIEKDTITLNLNQQLREKFTKVITQKN